jgi:hypothetical protein
MAGTRQDFELGVQKRIAAIRLMRYFRKQKCLGLTQPAHKALRRKAEMADTTPVSTNNRDDARALLNRIPALQRPCDLDLLVFFARHWRTLVSSEQLARLLGYPLKEIARSRDVLVAAGLLTRAHDPARPQRMYELDPGCLDAGPLPAIVTLASTPAGRLSLRRALTMCAPAADTADVSARDENHRIPRSAPPSRNDASPKRSRSTERRSNEQPERTQ